MCQVKVRSLKKLSPKVLQDLFKYIKGCNSQQYFLVVQIENISERQFNKLNLVLKQAGKIFSKYLFVSDVNRSPNNPEFKWALGKTLSENGLQVEN